MISPETLRAYPYFADVSEESLRQVAMIADHELYPADKTLAEDGDPADYLYVVVDGEVDIRYVMGDGEECAVDTVVGGELAMWSALVAPYRSTARIRTRTDVKLVAISALQLRQLCEDNHDLGYRMLQSVTDLLSTRLTGARVQLAAMSSQQ